MAPILLNSRYNVLRSLRGNSLEKTFLAEDVHDPSRSYYVLKQVRLPSEPHQIPLAKELFVERIALLQQLAEVDNNILYPYDSFEESGSLFFIREWVDGTTLNYRTRRAGMLDESDVEALLLSVLEDLSLVHDSKTFHGNIKPSNIILRQRDGVPILTDFSMLPTSIVQSVPLAVGAPISTMAMAPSFAPPEQLMGNYFYSSDIYSLGLTAIYLLTGKFPHELTTHPETGELIWRSYAPEVDPGLAEVLDIAIQAHPEHRYANAAEMLDDLQTVERLVVPQSAVPPSSTDMMHALRVGVGICLSIGVFILGGLFLFSKLRPMFGEGVTSSSSVAPLSSGAASSGASGTLSPSASGNASSTPAVAGELSQEEAIAVVNRWLQSKQQIFSPPYNRELAAQLTTGKLYDDITKVGGSIDWLSQNNARYEFRSSQIQAVNGFSVNEDTAVLQATVTEDRTLYVGQQIDTAQSGNSTGAVSYELKIADGQWKLADYRYSQ